MNGDDPTTEAVELAERILDEVSRPDQDWWKIAGWARALAAVAAAADGRPDPGTNAEDR